MKFPTRRPPPLIYLPLLAATLAGWTSCNRDDNKITVYRIPKETPAPPTMPADGATSAAPLTVHWSAPSEWAEQPVSGFRKGSYLVKGPAGQTADVSVISFPQEAGGLLANVNRWRNQLKLAPLTDVVRAGMPMEVAGRDLFFVDLVSEQPLSPDGSKSRILGGVFPAGAETWFFKMTGPDALVEGQRELFKKFLESVHPEGAEASTAPPPMPRPMNANAGGNDTNAPTPPPIATAQGAPVQYSLPPGWEEKPLTPMRLASFKTTAPEGEETDVSVVSLPGVAGGNLANVNRWRGQMQLAPLDEATLAQSVEHVRVNGHDFLLVDLPSQAPIKGEQQRILAAILDEKEHSWFIKMTGETTAVASQKEAFIDFLRGLKIP